MFLFEILPSILTFYASYLSPFDHIYIFLPPPHFILFKWIMSSVRGWSGEKQNTNNFTLTSYTKNDMKCYRLDFAICKLSHHLLSKSIIPCELYIHTCLPKEKKKVYSLSLNSRGKTHSASNRCVDCQILNRCVCAPTIKSNGIFVNFYRCP